MAQSTQKSGVIAEINVTPLVDVVLVLLVILMTTASYAVSKAIPVDLPAGATGERTPETLAITVDRDGRTHLEGKPVDRDALRSAVRAARSRDAEARAVLAADGATAHREVVRVIDLLRQEGLFRFAINVRADDLSRR